eukprot:797424_1
MSNLDSVESVEAYFSRFPKGVQIQHLRRWVQLDESNKDTCDPTANQRLSKAICRVRPPRPSPVFVSPSRELAFNPLSPPKSEHLLSDPTTVVDREERDNSEWARCLSPNFDHFSERFAPIRDTYKSALHPTILFNIPPSREQSPKRLQNRSGRVGRPGERPTEGVPASPRPSWRRAATGSGWRGYR